MMTALDLGLKASVLLALALAARPALRRAGPATRHTLLAAAVCVSLGLPLLSWVAPAWGTPLQPARSFTEVRLDDAAAWLPVVWMAGVAVHLIVLAIGLARLHWLERHAEPCDHPMWTDLALELAAEYRLPRPVVLLTTTRPTPPLTWGWRRPRVLLPARATDWSRERAALVLRHEFAHIRRRDWLVQIAASLLRALYWFSPATWLAAQRLRAESEQACDAVVIGARVPPGRYAAHLLDLAREHVHERREWAPAPGMARRSMLEARVRVLLDPRATCTPHRLLHVALCALVAGAALPVAGFGLPRTFDRPVVVLAPAPAVTLTLMLDGRLVDLSKGTPTYPDPKAGVIAGTGLPFMPVDTRPAQE